MAIIKGEKITLSALFKNDAGNNTTPGTPVKVFVRQPDGTLDVDDVTVAEDGSTTGLFEYEYTTSVAGIHNYKFKSSDLGIEQGTFTVNVDRA